MKRLRIICSVLCLALGVLLTSCSGRTDVSSGESYIFCLNTDRTGLVKISYDIPEGNAQEAAEAVLDELKKPAEEIEYTPALPRMWMFSHVNLWEAFWQSILTVIILI